MYVPLLINNLKKEKIISRSFPTCNADNFVKDRQVAFLLKLFFVYYANRLLRKCSIHRMCLIYRQQLISKHLTAGEDAIGERRSFASTFWAATLAHWQRVPDLQDEFAELALGTRRIVLELLVARDDGVVGWGATPVVRAATVFVVDGNATGFDVIGFEQFNVAADSNAILVLGNWFVLEGARANTFVTFKILWLHSLAFFVLLSFELTRR